MDKLLNLIGLAQKAGRLAVGEEPTGAAARARDARLILVAADAAENSVRRVRHFADAGQCLWCRIGADKDALGRAVGRSSCAMLAVMDIGFAEAIATSALPKRRKSSRSRPGAPPSGAGRPRRMKGTSAPARSVRRRKRRRQAKRSRSGRKSVPRCGLPRERAESARPARRAAAMRRSRAARSVSAAPSRRRQERATRIPVRSSAARAARKKRSSNSVPSHLEVLYWLLRRTRTR